LHGVTWHDTHSSDDVVKKCDWRSYRGNWDTEGYNGLDMWKEAEGGGGNKSEEWQKIGRPRFGNIWSGWAWGDNRLKEMGEDHCKPNPYLNRVIL